MSFPDRLAPVSLSSETRLPPLDRWALHLDIDGTLVDLAASPDDVVVPRTLLTLLPALSVRLNGALALISGRALESIDRLFAPLRLAASGQHGAEIRRHPHDPAKAFIDSARITAAEEALKSLEIDHPGVFVEGKGLSIAVHFRNAPDAEPFVRDAVAAQVAESEGALEMLGGEMVWDLHPRGLTKGTAIECLQGAPPFANRLPIFIGDDRTDEFGFTAAARLGGVGILVGQARQTAAAFNLPDPAACRKWLGALVEADL